MQITVAAMPKKEIKKKKTFFPSFMNTLNVYNKKKKLADSTNVMITPLNCTNSNSMRRLMTLLSTAICNDPRSK